MKEILEKFLKYLELKVLQKAAQKTNFDSFPTDLQKINCKTF